MPSDQRSFDLLSSSESSPDQHLFDELLHAESEEEVVAALKRAGYWDDADAWAVLGGEENNFSVASNQQTDPTSALVEKVINAIDAVLMAGAFAARVDPQGPDAPSTMSGAVEAFYGVRDGRLGDLTAMELGKLAQNIHVIASGPRDKPCYTIVDRGEGQTPKDFPDTFLSVAKSNKLRIPFVQGKYNSGGLGVLQFCGAQNLQLIASRRHPAAPSRAGDETRDSWGFTLIRRQAPSEHRRNSMYVYLAPNGRVPSFSNEVPPLVLPATAGKPPVPYSEPLEYGSVVKVYEYRWRAKSIATTEARFEFEKQLHAPCLPFRVTETRDYKANYYSTTVSGIWTAIAAEAAGDEDDRKVEAGYPADNTLVLTGVGTLNYQVVVFRREVAGRVVDTRRLPHGVFFTVNGQVHGQLPADFASRRLKFDYLRNHLFVSVDCSGMATMAREDFFMASRDRLRRNELYDELVTTLGEQLRDHPGLRALNAARRAAQLESTLSSEEDVLATIQSLLRHDPALRTLFGLGDRVVSHVGPTEVETFKGVRFPTYFRLRGSTHTTVCKSVPINRTCNVELETDASNDYFERAESPGRMSVAPDCLRYGRLWNGIYLARLAPPEGAQHGQVLLVRIEVTDPDRESNGRPPFVIDVEISVGKADDSHHGPGGPRRPTKPNGGTREAPRLAMPNVSEVHREQWEEFDPPFTEDDALRVVRAGDEEVYDFILNLDCKHLVNELRNTKPQDQDLVRYWFKWGLTLSAMGQLHYLKESCGGDGNGPASDGGANGMDEVELVNATISGLAMVVVPIIRQLSRGPVPD